MPARTPAINTPEYLIRFTLTPAASAASGFSPTARRRRPKGVRYITYQLIGTSANAMMIGVHGIRCSLGSCGVDPDERKNAPLKKPGIPNIRILMAAPLTT